MTNKEKAYQIAWQYSKHYDPNACKEEWVEMGAIDMAGYKDNEFKRVLDNTNFQAFTDFREYIQYIKEQLHID